MTAITEHYTLFMDLPLTSPGTDATGEPPYCLSQIAPVALVSSRHKDNSNIRWFEAPACYIFHT